MPVSRDEVGRSCRTIRYKCNYRNVDKGFRSLAGDGGDYWLGCGLACFWVGRFDLVAELEFLDWSAGAIGEEDLGAGDEGVAFP